MSDRDFEAESEDNDRARQHADDKIAAQKRRMAEGAPNEQQKIDDQQLINEMRGNKANLDLNRAMQDYDEEHKDEAPRAD